MLAEVVQWRLITTTGRAPCDPPGSVGRNGSIMPLAPLAWQVARLVRPVTNAGQGIAINDAVRYHDANEPASPGTEEKLQGSSMQSR
jgi:hypothetical protein